LKSVRSASDSAIRKFSQNEKKDWVVTQFERLRIVPEELWNAVKERQSARSRLIGERIKQGLSKAKASRTGAGPKYLASGLLRCWKCGSNYVICGRVIYGCSANVNGGATRCTNDARMRRRDVEEALVRGIKRELLTPAAIKETCRQVRELILKPREAPPNHKARISDLKFQIENVMEAIASGMMKASPALGAKLRDAETELEELEQDQLASESAAATATRLIPDLTAIVTRAVENLEETLASGDVARSRQEILAYVGKVTVEADEREIRLYSEQNHAISTLLRASGTHAIKCGSGGRI
jgi:site-specific DNA recombinase